MKNNSLNSLFFSPERKYVKQNIFFGHRLYWLGQICFFSIFLGFSFLIAIFYSNITAATVSISLLFVFFVFLVTHGIRYHYKIRAQDWPWVKAVFFLLALLPIFAVLIQSILFFVITFLNKNFASIVAGMTQYSLINFITYVIQTGIILCVWVMLYLMISQFRSKRKAEIAYWISQARLRETELQFLHNQINSHFLFNAMNNLRALIIENPELARDRLTQLSNLLRAVLQTGVKESITLAQEMVLIDSYLDLESLQLEERLQIEKNIDENILECNIPPMIIQTIVENAVSHGISRIPEGGRITITIQGKGDHFEIRISNPLPLKSQNITEDLSGNFFQSEARSSSSGYSIGLANVRKRLKIIYQDAASLDLINRSNSMTTILSIPL